MLPDEFDIKDFSDHLAMTGVSTSNRQACVRVVKKLITGQGVTHRNKPGEAFLHGYKVTPKDDIDAIRMTANAWLPCRKGPGCLDKGHGWALDHPLKKLKMFKDDLVKNSTLTTQVEELD